MTAASAAYLNTGMEPTATRFCSVSVLDILIHCTKSLRDSFGLTELVMLRGMLWCAASDRAREAVHLPCASLDVRHE